MIKKIIIGLSIIVIVIVIAGLFVFSKIPRPKAPEKKIIEIAQITERELNTGRIVGFVDKNNSHAWLGIPFAKPPVNELRWKASQPPESWGDTLETLEIGGMCTQYSSPLSGAAVGETGKVTGQEDCLYLNVWAPPFESDNLPEGDDRLPVMLWIHGGGNSIGHGGSYNGAMLATTHRLIVITINYRLGPFGWFTHPALRDTEASEEDNSGNYGTLDIIRALQWVQDNISNLGGNPGNVTIFGESAGAADVLSMMVSPKATGLFHRAIVESGGLWINSLAEAENYRDDAEAGHPFSSREVLNQLLVKDGIASTRDEAKTHQQQMSDREIVDYLYGKSAHEFMSVYDGSRFGMVSAPELVSDGAVLPVKPIHELFADITGFNSVPIILGTNRDEAKLFMATNPRYTKTTLGIFRRLKDQNAYLRDAQYLSDRSKVRGVDSLAAVLSGSQGETVFAYRFDWDEETSILGFDLSVALGAAHGLEIPFVFGDFDSGIGLGYIYPKDKTADRDALAQSMMSYWAEFAYSGNPGRGRNGREVLWNAWDNSSEESDKFIVFDTLEDRGIRMVSDAITMENLKKRLLSDSSFATQEEYCRTYATLLRFSDLWNQDEYGSLGTEGCKDFDPEQFNRF